MIACSVRKLFCIIR